MRPFNHSHRYKKNKTSFSQEIMLGYEKKERTFSLLSKQNYSNDVFSLDN